MADSGNPLVPYSVTTAVTTFTDDLYNYLDRLGLPTAGVLIEVSERAKVINNLPDVAEQVPVQQRTGALYLSKFTAACAAGLFDAALNYLWDETVANLRDKAARFDLQFFYDNAVPDPKRRPDFRSAEDLTKLADYDLVRGCLVTGIITDIGYKHLDYIRDMRNHASAAHPNQNTLSGLQIVAWLETCVREVLCKEPEEPAIEVKRLLHNLRTQPLSGADVPPIASAVALLPEGLIRPLLRSMFGMYNDPNLDTTARSNIALVGPTVWTVAGQDARYEAGMQYGLFAANGDLARKELARQFLEAVGGLGYMPTGTLAVEMDGSLNDLRAAHLGFDNFYNEPPRVRALDQLVPPNGAIPASVEQKYVEVLALCRMGNGYGVSRDAKLIYDRLLTRFDDRLIGLFVKGLGYEAEISSQLQSRQCQGECVAMAGTFRERTRNVLLQRALDVVLATPARDLQALRTHPRYQQAVAALDQLLAGPTV